MGNKFKMLALGAVFAVGASGAAMAQVCPAGYAWNGAACAPMATAPGYSYAPGNPVSGAAAGASAGAAEGAGAGGPAGAFSGGAIAPATGPLSGTTNMIPGAPPPPVGTSTPPAAY